MDLAFQRVGHRRCDDVEVMLEISTMPGSGGELRAHHEQLALQLEDARCADGRVGKRPGEPERGYRLVERPVGLRAEVVLGHAPAVEQVGLSPVAVSGGDAHVFVIRWRRAESLRLAGGVCRHCRASSLLSICWPRSLRWWHRRLRW